MTAAEARQAGYDDARARLPPLPPIGEGYFAYLQGYMDGEGER